MDTEIILIAFLIFAAAVLYSSVGHGGASGYLAVMALFSFAPETMRPTALILNICVAAIGAIKFARMGFFSWRKFYPFAIGSMPFAFIGGRINLPLPYFKVAVGLALVVAAVLLARNEDPADQSEVTDDSRTALAPDRVGGGDRAGIVVRIDRRRRRNLFVANPSFFGMDKHTSDGGDLGDVHPGQLDRRAHRKFKPDEPFHAALAGGSDHSRGLRRAGWIYRLKFCGRVANTRLWCCGVCLPLCW